MAETNKKIIKKGLFKGHPAVTIRLPITRSEKEDKWVCVNGKSMQIKRGVDVEVPVCVAEVLKHQEDALRRTMEIENTAMSKASDEELN